MEGDPSQCPFFDIFKPTLQKASDNVVQDICEVKNTMANVKSKFVCFFGYTCDDDDNTIVI